MNAPPRVSLVALAWLAGSASPSLAGGIVSPLAGSASPSLAGGVVSPLAGGIVSPLAGGVVSPLAGGAWLTPASVGYVSLPPPREPKGYRLDDYQAAVPETLNGHPALTVTQANGLFAEKVPFLDVLPRAPRPEGLAPGTVWVEKPHVSIEGAHWLPEVGRGEISAETEAYFRRALAKLSGGDASGKMVIFCKRQCWMSWNAAKRAQSYGYSQILWFSDGIEGWLRADLPTAIVTPDP